MGTSITGGQVVVRSLERLGVDTVFGIPGEHTLEIYRALARSPIRHVTARHEQGAGFMADGYARACGRPGVCLVVTGPGLTNVATPLAQAQTDGVPLLVLSGQIGSEALCTERAGGHFHELKNQLGMTRSLVGHAERIPDAAAIPSVLAEAFSALQSGRPGAIHLEFPRDVLTSSAHIEFNRIDVLGVSASDPPLTEDAARVLAQARQPAILAGGGARASSQTLLALAERLDAPILTTTAAAGSLPPHPLLVGCGVELTATRDFLQTCDVVLVVGSQLTEADFWPGFPTLRGRLVQIDLDADTIGRAHPVEVGVVGDAGQVLSQLLAAVNLPSSRGSSRAAALRKAMDAEAAPRAKPYRAVLEALAASLGPGAIVALDLTGPTYWGVPRFFPLAHPHRLLLSGLGTLGYALPGAIGAQLAQPEKQVAVIVGDGGFLFTCQELVTASELELPILILLWNNHGYGDIREQLLATSRTAVGVDLRTPDFLSFGQACGALALRLDDVGELPAVVRATNRRRCPTVVEIDAS